MSAARKTNRRRTIAADTPDMHMSRFANVIIDEDSVFDTSQVPDTAERTRQFLPSVPGRANPTRLANLPSFLPGENTFVCQSQQMAVSSTILESQKKSATKSARDRRKSNRRSNITREDLLSFILNKEKSPEAEASTISAEKINASEDDSDDSDNEDWDRLKSVHGSVQKYLQKPDPRQSIVVSGNVKSKTRACLSAPKSQQRKKIIKNLANDLRRKSLVNETIEEVSEEISKTKSDIGESSSSLKSSLTNIDPKLLVQSYQNFSTDSAKALIAQMEGGTYNSDKSIVRTSSQSSCDSNSDKESGNNRRKNKRRKGAGDKTSLTPVPMEEATPSIPRAISSPSLNVQSVSSPSLRPPPADVATPQPTQVAPVLDGVKIFVDFRTGHENLGKAIETKAFELGATISGKLTADVTHVIFKDGSLANYKRAKRVGSHIVSAKWLEDSRENGKKVAESEYPTVSRDKYESPGLFPKLRKLKSMQPKSLEEDFTAASKSLDRRLKIQARKNLLEIGKSNSEQKGVTTKRPPHNYYYKGCEKFYKRKSKENSLQELMKEIQNSPGAGVVTPVKLLATGSSVSSPVSPSSSEFDTPLAVRLARMYQSPLDPKTRTSLGSSAPSRASVSCSTPSRPSTAFIMETQEDVAKTSDAYCLPKDSVEVQQITNPSDAKSRGRKRKMDEQDSNEKTTTTEIMRSPLRDLSNTRRSRTGTRAKHKLLSQKFSQVLDDTFDQNQPSKVDHIENVHITQKKKVSTKPKTKPTRNLKPKLNSDSATDTKENTDPNFSRPVDSSEINTLNPSSMSKAKTKNFKSIEPRKSRRRTSFDFVPPTNLTQASRASSSRLSSKSSSKLAGFIALTSCDKEDKDLVKQLVKQLGVFGYQDNIDEKTTHVVSGAVKRTMNLIKGMVRGCWILSKDWILTSLEQGMWQQEDKFEMTKFSPAVKEVRRERQVFKGAYRSALFADVGTVYISSKCRVGRTDLRQVVSWAGGDLVNTARVAQVVVGEFCHVGDSSTPHFVKDTWILDSVQHNMVMPFLDYPL